MVDGDGDIIVIEPVKEMLLQRQRSGSDHGDSGK
jgi:hypothetical protein